MVACSEWTAGPKSLDDEAGSRSLVKFGRVGADLVLARDLVDDTQGRDHSLSNLQLERTDGDPDSLSVDHGRLALH